VTLRPQRSARPRQRPERGERSLVDELVEGVYDQRPAVVQAALREVANRRFLNADDKRRLADRILAATSRLPFEDWDQRERWKRTDAEWRAIEAEAHRVVERAQRQGPEPR
jgi:hypothetical protein